MTPCTRSSDCEFDANHWPHTPCGRQSVICPGCGFPAPREDWDDYEQALECPHGWRAATVADLKDLAAEAGVDTKVTIGDDGTVRAETLPRQADAPATADGAR